MSRKVPDGWTTYKLEDLAYLVKDRCKKEDKNKLKTDMVSAEFIFRKGDILFKIIRPKKQGVIISKSDGLCDNDTWIIRSKDKINQDFLFYLLKSKRFINLCISGITGAVIPRADWYFISKSTWAIPVNKNEQQAIVSILSCIDDKIILLYKENETLTKILDTCYKLYFTAKQTEKKQTVPLSDIAEIITGKTAPIEEYNKKEGKTVKIASVRDFDYSKIYITDTKEHITQEAVDKMHYTIAPANTVLFVFEMSPGKVALTDCPMVTKTAIAQLRIKDNTYINPEYLYLYLKHFNYNRFIKTYTIVNSIDKSKIGDIPIVIPDKETMDKFTEQVVPLFTKVKTNNYAIQTLERLRDALLPALMSGKIRVV